MLRKTTLALTLVILVALAVAVFGAAAQDDKVGLTLINRSDQPVTLTLSSGDVYYYLYVPADSTKVFTVDPLTYTHNTFACGSAASGTLEVSGQTRLVFTRCALSAPNAGEPTQEKVHLDDSPSGFNWYYQY
jgi:hypothetical protein